MANFYNVLTGVVVVIGEKAMTDDIQIVIL